MLEGRQGRQGRQGRRWLRPPLPGGPPCPNCVRAASAPGHAACRRLHTLVSPVKRPLAALRNPCATRGGAAMVEPRLLAALLALLAALAGPVDARGALMGCAGGLGRDSVLARALQPIPAHRRPAPCPDPPCAGTMRECRERTLPSSRALRPSCRQTSTSRTARRLSSCRCAPLLDPAPPMRATAARAAAAAAALTPPRPTRLLRPCLLTPRWRPSTTGRTLRCTRTAPPAHAQ